MNEKYYVRFVVTFFVGVTPGSFCLLVTYINASPVHRTAQYTNENVRGERGEDS